MYGRMSSIVPIVYLIYVTSVINTLHVMLNASRSIYVACLIVYSVLIRHMSSIAFKQDKPEPNPLWMLIGKKYAFFNLDFALTCQDVWSYMYYSAYSVSNICYKCHKYITRDVKYM